MTLRKLCYSSSTCTQYLSSRYLAKAADETYKHDSMVGNADNEVRTLGLRHGSSSSYSQSHHDELLI